MTAALEVRTWMVEMRSWCVCGSWPTFRWTMDGHRRCFMLLDHLCWRNEHQGDTPEELERTYYGILSDEAYTAAGP